MATQKRKRLSLVEKYKAITELESGTKPSKVAEKYGVPRNTISTWLLPENKEKIKSLVQAWNRVSKETIQNCFRCAGISLETQADAIEDNDDPFKSLQSDG